MIIDVGREFEIFTSEKIKDIIEDVYPEVFDVVLNIALELAAQGREAARLEQSSSWETTKRNLTHTEQGRA
jgi:hypothetical protein